MNKKPRFTLKKTVMATAFACVFTVLPANASLKNEMDTMFMEMSNVTQPGVYQSQRRGAVFGGRVTTKNRVIKQNLVSFIPPSAKAGCGGIDFFGGSFSFINADQLVQLMRAVAQNAVGYAFQLALEAVCSPCHNVMSELQKRIQDLNNMLGNSCQLAQGIVNESVRSLNETFRKDEQNQAAETGTMKDHFMSIFKPAGEEQKRDRPDVYDKLIGNLVWNELKKNRIHNWFAFGDDNLLEAMISITGSLIVGDQIDDPNAVSGATAGKTNKISDMPGNVLTLKALIEGTAYGEKVNMYHCEDDKCAGPDGQTTPSIRQHDNFDGLGDRIRKRLIGGDGQVGIVQRYAMEALGGGGTLAPDEQNFITALPYGMGGMLRTLAILNETAATQFVQQHANVIALNMAYNLSFDLMRSAELAAKSSDNAYASRLSEIFNQSRNALNQEYQTLTNMHGKLTDIQESYQRMMALVEKQRYEHMSRTNRGVH